MRMDHMMQDDSWRQYSTQIIKAKYVLHQSKICVMPLETSVTTNEGKSFDKMIEYRQLY